MTLKILAIGAHPDDVEIGAGGILNKHYAAGDKITILTLTRGARGGEGRIRAEEAAKAAALIGADFHLGQLEDTQVSDGGPTINVIENLALAIQPDVVYTHTEQDRHQDHRNASRATQVACRDVAKIYGYQSPSTTVDFRPTRFVGIDGYLDGKLAMIGAHVTQEFRDYLEDGLIRATARYWGQFARRQQLYAEPFEVILDREFDFAEDMFHQ